MQRSHLIAAVAVLCLVGAVAAPALGHPSHVSVGPQSSPDGTVVVGSVFTIDTGFLVLYTDDGGDLGQRVGHVRIENGVQTGVEVDLYDDAWADWDEPRRVWTTIHRDENGNGEFDPDEDPVVREAGSFVGTDFYVERSEAGRSLVTGGSSTPQLVDSPALTVPRAAVETDGYLAIHADQDGQPGRVVGQVALDAGDHRNVSVDVDEGYFAERNGTFRVHATLYEDDGDGQFDPDADSRVSVAGRPVTARLDLRKVEDAGGNGTDDGTDDVVVTASDTDTTGGDDGGGLPTPGFGALAAGLVVLATVLALARRR